LSTTPSSPDVPLESKAEEIQFVPFKDLNAVPAELMLHQGARLTLEMVNTLCDRAYELGTPASPNLGEAWVKFRDSHRIENDLWVKN
jgi:hypothetical protein